MRPTIPFLTIALLIALSSLTSAKAEPPVAEFWGAPTAGSLLPFSVVFIDQSTNNPTSWLWDFGDGINSTAQHPSHTYFTDGYYTVTLTVTNDAGSDSETKSGYVHVNANGQDAYQQFNQFCIDNFGAEHEPLTYQVFGNTTYFVESGFWLHESRNSAAIAFETNLPTNSSIEYGETTAYGSTTNGTDRYYYLHLHYLTGLQPETTYHYRMVAVDERGNRINSPDKNFSTHDFPEAILFPGSLSGPPYVLDQPNKVYILTEDIDSQTRGISIKAGGITVDLNGHTIIYDQGPSLEQPGNYYQINSDVSSAGVHLWPWVTGLVKILNGIIIQGQTNSQGYASIGFNPILLHGGTVEVAGITATYSGNSVGGIINVWGETHAHHNVLVDRGTGVDRRDLGIISIVNNLDSSEGLHHNLIKRARHQVLVDNDKNSGTFYSNEIYMDSFAVNDFGIKATGQFHDNKIFGTGYHLDAIWTKTNSTYRNNFIHLQCVAPTDRFWESGTYSSMAGIRLTEYICRGVPYDDVLFEGNTIIIKSREGCSHTRGGAMFSSDPSVVNLRFINNTIKTEVQDDMTLTSPTITGHGSASNASCANESLPIIYENNTLITNSVFMRFGDDYGGGGHHHFKSNVFQKFGSRTDYTTILVGYNTAVDYMFDNIFIDSILGNGVDLEDNLFAGMGRREYTVGHSLYVTAQSAPDVPIANALLEVLDNTGSSYNITTDSQGHARLELLEYTYAAATGVPTATKTIHQNHKLHINGFENYTITTEQFAIRNNGNAPVTLLFAPLGQSSCPSHDTNDNSIIETSELRTALNDWFSGTLNMQNLLNLMGDFKRETCT